MNPEPGNGPDGGDRAGGPLAAVPAAFVPRTAADAYADRTAQGVALDQDDEEMDLLHERLTREIAAEEMSTTVAAQLTLLARFYERLGDHAVNLAHRIDTFPSLDS